MSPDQNMEARKALSQGNETVCRLRYTLDERDRVFTIGKRPVVIGRAPDSDLLLHNESISRQHTRIAYEEDGWVLRDLGSKNGSRVNTFHVEEQLLRNGDRIDLGTRDRPHHPRSRRSARGPEPGNEENRVRE